MCCSPRLHTHLCVYGVQRKQQRRQPRLRSVRARARHLPQQPPTTASVFCLAAAAG
jgi:hypothetical protein